MLLAASVRGAKIKEAEIKTGEKGLGTPAKSPYENWSDPLSGQAWRAADYKHFNALPGSAVTLRVRLNGTQFRALFPVVSTNDNADTIGAAKDVLKGVRSRTREELEADSQCATPAERVGGKYVYQQDLAFSSVFSAKFCFSDKTYWHGDYHFNELNFSDYFIRGRTTELETYFQMVEANLPAAQALAREVFGCRGAAWPIASFPARFKRLPLTNLSWDYSLECTGLVIQPFWLTYLYNVDSGFLRKRAYPIVKEAAIFYADYVTMEDDGLYHIWPCTSSEHVTLQPYLKYNRDSNASLTMTKYFLKAGCEGAQTLNVDEELAQSWQKILERLAPYPVEETPEGPRFVDVAGARLMTEYNIFSPLFAVFYGNDIGLASPEEEISKAKRSLKGIVRLSTTHWPHVYRAMIRLGMYPGGKIDCENLIQSQQGPIFLFPAVPEGYSGDFKDYHAQGGFVVSAKCVKGKVKKARIRSLAGMKCSIDIRTRFDRIPKTRCPGSSKKIQAHIEEGRYLSFETEPGKTYELVP